MDESPYSDALQTLREQARLRECRNIDAPVEIVNFSSNDYLGLSGDARLKDAAIEAVRRHGTGSGGSRLITGTRGPVLALEEALARFKNTEAALVFNSGYQANVAILQAILEPGDWVFADRLNHASLVDGMTLSGARWTRYRHLDLEDLDNKLKKAPPAAKKWVVTDSVFSMDGDYGDLAALCELAERHDAYLLVDEAHATGLYGKQRYSGLCEQFGVSRRVTLQMGTFSKALGGFGAYVAGSRTMMDFLTNRARGFIYSTALPPAVIGAAQAAVEIVRQDPQPREQLWENVRIFSAALKDAGLPLSRHSPQSPIIPLLVGDDTETMRVSQQLLEAGYLVQGIRPPTVPPGTARLRITVRANHTTQQLQGLAAVLAQYLPAKATP